MCWYSGSRSMRFTILGRAYLTTTAVNNHVKENEMDRTHNTYTVCVGVCATYTVVVRVI